MILIVDDDKTLAKLATRMLEGDGYEVAVAHNGEDAYTKIQAGGIDCVLLDMHMPKVNGAELLMLLSADGDTTPVLVMATFHDFDEKELKNFPNVKGLFHKPFYPEELLEKVRELTGKNPKSRS
jgi:DNA-binding response OmpR family regulator